MKLQFQNSFFKSKKKQIVFYRGNQRHKRDVVKYKNKQCQNFPLLPSTTTTSKG